MNALIIAAEAALIELKDLHNKVECRMPACCPAAAAIAALEVEIARAKRAQGITFEIPNSPEDWDPKRDPEFQAVSGFDPKEHLPVMINPPA